MDYNIEPGIGTDLHADSAGDGMLSHERAYLKWLEAVFKRYPDLVIENCSSGGLRMDYAMLSRYSIQSTSDQDDYRYYCTIAANSPSALTPEQSAIWSYPLREGDREEVVFNMVNAMLLRIHQSGHLAELTQERRDLVKEALDIYKTIRKDIKNSVPIWPIGLSQFHDEWTCLGLQSEKKIYLAVWRRNGNKPVIEIPFEHLNNKEVSVSCLYPSYSEVLFSWSKESNVLTVTMEKEFMARLFCIEIK